MSLHSAQISILRTLRRNQTARFSDLMRPSGMSSDTFKFHLKKLVQLGYIQKTPENTYQLTRSGKEFSNNLDESRGTVQKQSKISLLLQVTHPGTPNGQKFLFQRRFRSPFYGYWGNVSGPAKWGQAFEETAALELKKQTGLSASFQVKKFIRARDFTTEGQALLEDKLFVVLSAHNTKGVLSNTWDGGQNTWMTLEEFNKLSNHFIAAEQSFDDNLVYENRSLLYNPATY